MSTSLQQPIVSRASYQLLADALRERVLRGALAPGSALPSVRALSSAYGVGQSTVREALRLLEAQGLIDQTKAGATVSEVIDPFSENMRLLVDLDRVGAAELLELRETLEVAIAGRAAEHRTDADLRQIDATIQAMALASADEKRRVEHDLAFHASLAQASGNALYLYMIQAVRQGLRQVLRDIGERITPPAARALASHREILDAVRQRDARLARDAMAVHLADFAAGLYRSGVARAAADCRSTAGRT